MSSWLKNRAQAEVGEDGIIVGESESQNMFHAERLCAIFGVEIFCISWSTKYALHDSFKL
jgi:hypothetical protein